MSGLLYIQNFGDRGRIFRTLIYDRTPIFINTVFSCLHSRLSLARSQKPDQAVSGRLNRSGADNVGQTFRLSTGPSQSIGNAVLWSVHMCPLTQLSRHKRSFCLTRRKWAYPRGPFLGRKWAQYSKICLAETTRDGIQPLKISSRCLRTFGHAFTPQTAVAHKASTGFALCCPKFR